MNVEVWKYENVKMVELWNGGMQKHFHILSFHHPTISILSHSHIALIRVRLHDPPVRRREGGRGQGRLRTGECNVRMWKYGNEKVWN